MITRKRIGIMTGGGDCPGLNAAIRATAKTAMKSGYEVLGIRNGWKGLLDDEYMLLDGIRTSGIIDRGGTILGTSRVSPLREENGVQRTFDGFKRLGLEALVVLGGEGTLTVTSRLFDMGLPVVGIPKTIDNDVLETNFSIGFQTAVQIATDALDRLRSTAESHHRVMVLEVMGRTVGWIATFAGLANGADAILIPEIPVDEKAVEDLCRILVGRNRRGIGFSIVVVAEGVQLYGKSVTWHQTEHSTPEQRAHFGGVANVLGHVIEEKTGLETRVSSLDYIQRGGTPVAYDRSLATVFGVKATQLVREKKYGRMTALKGDRVVSVPLTKVADGVKTVDLKVYNVARMFFG